MSLIDAALRGMLIALLLLMALALRRDRPTLPAARAATLLCAGLVLQVIGSAPSVELGLSCRAQSPLVAVAVGNAVLFWVFVAALFDDEFAFRPYHALAWLGAAAIGALQCGVLGGLGDDARALVRALLRAVPLACTALAVWAAVRQWRADLVELRRGLRLFIVVAGGLYSLAQLAARMSTPAGLFTPLLALLDAALLLVVVAGAALLLLRVRSEALFPRVVAPPFIDAQSPSPALAHPVATGRATDAAEAAQATEPALPPPDTAEQALAAALERAMRDDRVYRVEDLGVAALAGRLGVPEYRLRRHINQRLGFRNFNAYINHWRLVDAQRWLADPAQAETPILTLALDAGFQSIGPFNRAFKAATGLTPSEFRRRRTGAGGAADGHDIAVS